MPEPASKPAPSRSVPVHAARAAGPARSFVFSRERKVSKAKTHRTKPLKQTHRCRQSDIKGIIKAQRSISPSSEIGVKTQSKQVCDGKKKEEEVKILPSAIIAFESVQISHTQPSQIALG